MSSEANSTKTEKSAGKDTNPNNINWTKVEEAETLRIKFFETPKQFLQYSVDIVWQEPGCPEGFERMKGLDCSNCNVANGEGFVEIFEEAAKRAVKVKTLIIGYYNGQDRRWPYTKISRICQVFTAINGMDATLESCEEDYYVYTVKFSPPKAKEQNNNRRKKNNKKRKRGNDDDEEEQEQPFAVNIDLSKRTGMEAISIMEYVGKWW